MVAKLSARIFGRTNSEAAAEPERPESRLQSLANAIDEFSKAAARGLQLTGCLLEIGGRYVFTKTTGIDATQETDNLVQEAREGAAKLFVHSYNGAVLSTFGVFDPSIMPGLKEVAQANVEVLTASSEFSSSSGEDLDTLGKAQHLFEKMITTKVTAHFVLGLAFWFTAKKLMMNTSQSLLTPP